MLKGICPVLRGDKSPFGANILPYKTTTAVNLATALALSKKKVLMVDIDPQGNATSGMGIDKKNIQNSVYDMLMGDLEVSSVILKSQVQGLDVIPSHIELAGAEVELVSMVSRETRLKNALRELRDAYDYILMDCPPSLGLLTLNAFTASDGILVPIQSEYYALEGLSQLMNTIKLVQKHLNPDLTVEGVVMTMYDARTNLSSQVYEEVKKHFGEKVFKTVIGRNIRLSEAPSFGKPIFLYDDKSKGAENYRKLAKELIQKNKGVKKL
jgi:chromosome partitioning protein